MRSREGPAEGHGHRAALERAIAETDGILRTFATLMEIARAESGKADIAMTPVDLRAVVADMVELYAPLAEQKRLAIEAALDEVGHVAGHGQFLSQLVANLLDNALGYTAEGGIGVSLAREPSGAVRLAVEDSGPGIPPAERERVLQRFVRLDRSRTDGGSGLGLSLVAGVASLHRAALALDESPLGGLRVSVTFPPSAE